MVSEVCMINIKFVNLPGITAFEKVLGDNNFNITIEYIFS